MTEDEFNNIKWPEEFYIKFINGDKQLCVSSQGISWESGADEINENRPNISCCWQKKSPSQQRFRPIHIWVDEIDSIQQTDGTKLWTIKA